MHLLLAIVLIFCAITMMRFLLVVVFSACALVVAGFGVLCILSIVLSVYEWIANKLAVRRLQKTPWAAYSMDERPKP